MTEDERKLTLRMIENWKEVDAVQRNLRRESIRSAVLADSINALDSAFRSAIWLSGPKQSSGLVEVQRILARSK